MTEQKLDPRIKALCDRVTAKRARTVIDHIIQHGHITTEELQTLYGYDHPPRAARDVRENGVPLKTFRIQSERTGRQIGAYRFGDPSEIKRGRIGGRQAFSKKFKEALVEKYGSADAINGERMESRYLQIDHRVPYEVAGDEAFDESKLEEYMLLDASSQRAKSWSCEHCSNWKNEQNESVCRTCYWAFPEKYTHVALEEERRIDIVFRGDSIDVFDNLVSEAKDKDCTVPELIKVKLA